LNVILFIDSVHFPDVEKNQHNKYINRALLCEPEAQFKSTNPDLIELIDKKNAGTEGNHEPDGEQNNEKSEVFAPISFGSVLILKRHRASFIVSVGEVPGALAAGSRTM
jgi:hypothetical protein